MYNYTDIKVQNKHDYWSLLYLHLAQAAMEGCGRGAEGAIRAAMQRMGAAHGEALLKRHRKEGVLTNLQNFYRSFPRCVDDPRMRLLILSDTQQVQLWEVHTCANADLWNKAGEGSLGAFFCEEYPAYAMLAYTEGKGQANLSKRITCERDNHCRFSMYCRPANMPKEQAALSFGEGSAALPMDESDGSRNERTAMLTISTLRYLFEALGERFGNEGICAFANGLRAASNDIAPLLRVQASHTLRPCDAEFLKANFPLSLSADETLWQMWGSEQAREQTKINLLDRLSGLLELDEKENRYVHV